MHLVLFAVLDSGEVIGSLIDILLCKGSGTEFQNANKMADISRLSVMLLSPSNYSLSDSWDTDDKCVHNSVTHILAPHSSFLALLFICGVVIIVFYRSHLGRVCVWGGAHVHR